MKALEKLLTTFQQLHNENVISNLKGYRLNNGTFASFTITPKELVYATQSKVIPVRGGSSKLAKVPNGLLMNKVYGTTKWSELAQFNQAQTNQVLRETDDFAIITDKMTVIDYDYGVFSDEELQELSIRYFDGQPIMMQTSSYGKHCHLFFKGDTLNVGNKVKTFKIELHGKTFNTDIRTKGGYCILQNSEQDKYGQIRVFIPLLFQGKSLATRTDELLTSFSENVRDFAMGETDLANANQTVSILPKLATPNSNLVALNLVQSGPKEVKVVTKNQVQASQAQSDESSNQVTKDDYVTDIITGRLQNVVKFNDTFSEGSRNSTIFTLASFLALKNLDINTVTDELVRINRHSNFSLDTSEVVATVEKVFNKLNQGKPYGITEDNADLVETATGMNIWDKHLPLIHSKVDYAQIDKYKDVCISDNNRPYIIVQQGSQSFKRLIKKDAHELVRTHADMAIEELTQAIKENRPTLQGSKVTLSTLTDMFNTVRQRRHVHAKPVQKKQVSKNMALLKSITDKIHSYNNADLIYTIVYNKMNSERRESEDYALNTTYYLFKRIAKANAELKQLNKRVGSFDVANHSQVRLDQIFTKQELRAIDYLNVSELINLTQINFDVTKGVYGGYTITWEYSTSIDAIIREYVETKINQIKDLIKYFSNENHNSSLSPFERGSFKRGLIKVVEDLQVIVDTFLYEEQSLSGPPQVA